ncbi:hypothetical protein ACFLZN_02340 [Nanoarchaeota archaeon]
MKLREKRIPNPAFTTASDKRFLGIKSSWLETITEYEADDRVVDVHFKPRRLVYASGSKLQDLDINFRTKTLVPQIPLKLRDSIISFENHSEKSVHDSGIGSDFLICFPNAVETRDLHAGGSFHGLVKAISLTRTLLVLTIEDAKSVFREYAVAEAWKRIDETYSKPPLQYRRTSGKVCHIHPAHDFTFKRSQLYLTCDPGIVKKKYTPTTHGTFDRFTILSDQPSNRICDFGGRFLVSSEGIVRLFKEDFKEKKLRVCKEQDLEGEITALAVNKTKQYVAAGITVDGQHLIRLYRVRK